MSTARAAPIFSASQSSAVHVALVSITVSARAVVYSDARCPNCKRLVMALPGTPVFEVRARESNDDRQGRGAVVSCHRCKTLCEVIVHR